MRERLNWDLLRLILLVTLILNASALYQMTSPVIESGRLFISFRWQFAVALGIFAIFAEIVILIITWTSRREIVHKIIERVLFSFSKLKWLNLVLFGLGIVLFSYLTLETFSLYSSKFITRLFLFWLAVLGGSILLKAWFVSYHEDAKKAYGECLGASLLFFAFGYLVGALMTNVSTYPFTIGWSETSRYYYASLFFSESIYGFTVPPTVLHPSRYLMQAVPFLLENSPLWLHRLWQVFLWVATTLATSALLACRLSIDDKLRKWMLILWSFLWLMLGPVYYHLQVVVVLILWGFKPYISGEEAYQKNGKSYKSQRFLISLVAVLFASIWAGVSRINWYPVPGMLVAALYFLEVPLRIKIEGSRKTGVDKSGTILGIQIDLWRYMLVPLAWAAFSMIIAFISQSVYVYLSGNPVGEYTSSFTSQLLWYRLLPNPTYTPGILLSTLFVSLPLLLIIWYKLTKQSNGISLWRMYHPIRFVGIAAMLIVLLVGGLVVSVKIGGGSNLHNLDAYFTLLWVFFSYILFERSVPDLDSSDFRQSEFEYQSQTTDSPKTNTKSGLRREKVFLTSLGLTIVIPIWFALVQFGAFFQSEYKFDTVEKDLNTLKESVQKVSRKGGDILFVTNRHLLTFGIIEDVPLIPEYERVFLMEMVMGNNLEYLGRFQKEIRDREYALIVIEPLFTKRKGSTERFGEENDEWVKQVAKHIRCSYKPIEELPDVNIFLYGPRKGKNPCK